MRDLVRRQYAAGGLVRIWRGQGSRMLQHRLARHRLLAARAALLIAAITLTSCGSLSSETYRYRMTVEVETSEGIRSGSSVIEVTTWKGVAFPGPEAGGLQNEVRGEAVAVDLPGGRTVFALLRRPDFEDAAAINAQIAFASRLRDIAPSDWRGLVRALRHMQGAALLPPSGYPTIVYFANPRDPRTIQALDRSHFRFGNGARVRRILIEITDDPVTWTIERRLPPFGQGTGFSSWRRNLDYYDPRNVTLNDFIKR